MYNHRIVQNFFQAQILFYLCRMRITNTIVKPVIFILIFSFSGILYPQDNQPEMTFNLPAEGMIASLFGWRMQSNDQGLKEKKFHKGIDIAGKYGAPVYASQEGEIVFVGMNGGYGKFIEIKHNDRYSTAYGHLRKYYVKLGDYVYSGQKIGEIGNSGTTFSTIGGKGVHLHFEIRDNIKMVWYSPKGAVNPKKYLDTDVSMDKYAQLNFSAKSYYMVSFGPVCVKTLIRIPEPKIQESRKYFENNNEISGLEMIPCYLLNVSEKIKFPEVVALNRIEKKPEVFFTSSAKTYGIQVEAHNCQLPENQAKKLERKYNIAGVRCSKVEIKGKTWYKYSLGIFESLEEAKEIQKIMFPEDKANQTAICVFDNDKMIKTIW